MSFIQKIFGTAPQPAPVVTPSNNPANNPAPPQPLTTDKTAPNGVVPHDGQKTQADQSPLDQFSTLWEPTPVDPKATPNPDEVNITQEQFLEAAGKIDFTKIIPAEDLTKIAAGGQEGTQAFLSAMNKVVQTSFGQSMAAAQKIVDRKTAALERKFSEQVPQAIRNQNVNRELLAKNPALAHPSVQPVITAIQKQMADQYPKATEAELREKAETYFLSMGEVFNPAAKPKKEEPKVPANEDWSDLA